MIRIVGILTLVFSMPMTGQTFKVCYEEWRPYAYTENNTSVGTIINKMQQVSLKHDLTFEFLELPHSRCLKSVDDGVNDLVLFVDQNDGYEMFPSAISYWHITLAIRESDEYLKLFDPKIAARRIMVSREYHYDNSVYLALESLKARVVKGSYYAISENEIRNLFRFLSGGQVDAIMIDRTWANLMIQRYDLPVKLVPEFLISEPQFVGYKSLTKRSYVKLKAFMADYEASQ